jgi:hypothetical protein
VLFRKDHLNRDRVAPYENDEDRWIDGCMDGMEGSICPEEGMEGPGSKPNPLKEITGPCLSPKNYL